VSGAIKVNPLPTIITHPSISSQSPKCLNEVFSALSVSASAGSGSILKYEWYSNTTNSTSGGTLVATNTTTSTTNTYTPPSSSPGVLYYYVIVYNTNNCQFTSNVSAPFTVNDLPSISVQPSTSNQTACLNTATTGLTVNASPGVNGNISSYTWYRTSNLSATPVVWTTVATNTTSSTTNTYTPASNTVGTLYYRVLVTNSYACSKYSEASGSVTINPVAIIPNQDDKYCSGTPFSKTLTSGTNITVPANTTYSWNTPVVTGGITGGAPGTAQPTINGTLTNPTNTPQTATYTVTPRTGTCDGATFTYTVTINPKATITVPDLNSCSGLAFTFTPEHGTNGIIPANTTYAWSIPSVTGGVTGGVAASNRISLGGNLTNPTNAQQKATYTLTPTSPGGPCIGSDFTIVVNVNARPVIANKTQPICSGTAFSITPVNTLPDIVPANTTYSWTVIDNPFVTGDTDGSTNGNTISQTLTNNSNEVRTVVYTVTPVSGDAGNCTGPSFTITVTVNPRPRISAKTVPACSNANFTTTITNAVDNDIVPLGTTYTWSLPIVTGGMTGGATGTGATSVSGNLINPTSVEQTATYTVSPSFISTAPGSTSCTGPDFTVVATIKPKVNIVTPPTASACSNDLFTFSLTNGAGGNVIPIGTTYTWTSVPTVTGGLTGGATGSNLNTIGGTLVNPSNTSQFATYKVTANSNDCFSAEFSATATIYARPFIKTTKDSTCSGTPFSVLLSNGGGNILPTGTTYTWTVAQNNFVTGEFDVTVPTSNISQTLTNITNTNQVVIYTVTPISGIDGNCEGLPFTVNITVKPKPAVTETQEISICSGDEFINEPLNGNGNIIPIGTRYAWTTPVSNPVGAVLGGLPQASPQTQVRQVLTNNTNKPATLTYTVTPSANGCSGSSYPLTINVNPKPNITTSPETICSGQTFTVIPVNVTNGIVPVNTKYTWEVADNPNVTGESNVTTAVSFISQTLINTSNITQPVIYTVRPKSGDAGTCLGNPFTLIVNVNPQPDIRSIPPQTICSGNSFFITPVNLTNGIVPSNTRYTWGNPNDNPIGSITGQSAQLVAVPPSISQPLNNITNTPATITYTITPIAGACTGPDFTAVITVNPKPTITAPPETICSEGTFTVLPIDGINGIVPNPTTYTWNIPVSNPPGAITGWATQTTAANNISQKLTNTTNAAATLTYLVIPRSGAAGNCQGDPFNVVVNVNAKPVIGNQNLAPICSGQTFNVPLTNGGSTIIPFNTTYTWVVSTNNPDISGQSDVSTDQQFITQTLTNNTNVVRQITYRVTPKSGATGNCVGAPFFVTVTVNPKPSVTTLPETICSENSFSIEPVNITNGIVPANTSYTWTTPTSNPASAISGGIAQSSPVFKISQLLTNNSNFRGTLTYRVTPTSGAAGACIGDPFNVEVTVNPKPVLTSTLTPNAICNERNFFYNPTSPTEGRSWVWTRNVVAGITNTQATGTGDINETLINTTPNRITVPYTFALTSFGCPNTQTVNVIVNPTPKLTTLLINPAQCSGAPFFYTPNSGTSGTTYTWTRANIAGISNPAANGSGAISETLINTSPNPIIVNYEYTLTANGCNNTQIVSVTIDPLPIANFNIGGVRADCGPITRTFINNSSVNSSPLTNGTFTWGIGVIKNGANIPVFSNVNTDYTTQVTYTFTNNKGIRDSLYPIFLTAKSPNGCLNTYTDTITVRPDANIDLTINSEAACAPFNAINSINVVNKIDPSPNPTINLLSSYKWTIRDRNGVVVSNTVSPNPPNFIITNPDDTLYLALKVNSIYGCKPDSVNRKVFTYKNPIVNFSVAPQNSCTLLETQAINNSYIGTNTNRTTSSLLYEWYANNSLISRAAGPVNFKLPNNSNTIDANYTIKLVVTENINNCKDSSSIGNLIVYPKPKAIFTIDKGDTTCTTVNGVNSSVSNSSLFKTGTIPQYRWSVTKTNLLDTARAIIIDSTTSPFIAARPNFQFKDAQGTIDTSYNINMMVTTIDGCKDTLTRKIVIARRPKVEFSIPQEACGIFNLVPVDNTINIPNDSLNRQWSVLPAGGLSILNATTFNPTINFPVNRTASSIAYEVKQAVASKIGCLDDLKKIITIHPKPTASFIVGKTDSCGPWTKTFINTSDAKNGLGINGITSRWEIKLNNRIELNTNTRNLTYTFTNTGVVDNVYTVTLFVSNPQGCLDTTAIQEITVHPNARAFFNDNTKGCAPFRIRDYIKVQDFPEANDIWRYEWRIFDRFGFLLANYDSSVLAPDYVIENESDTVTLQLIAYSKWNCTQDIFSRKIITYPNSVHANAESASTICSGLPLVFKNKSYYGNNFQTDNLQYQWFVNDVKVSTETNPTFTFNNSSNIVDSIVNVKLLVTYTNTGCDQTWSKDITVFPAPLAKFSVANVEICGNPSGFKNYITESIIAKNNVYSPVWTITNLTTSKPAALNILPTSTNKEYQLQLGDNNGNIDTVYAVNLSVTSVNGCKSDATTNIALYRRPDVKFSISNTLVCGESTLQITDQTTNVPTSKVWSYTTPTGGPLTFFPSATATNPKVLVPPNITGNLVTYYIKQNATTVNGCTESFTIQLDAKALPTAKFSMSETSSCLETATIKFTDESVPRTPETIIGWAWDFGDGSTSNVKNPSHNFSKPGTYTISLVITNNEGCSSLPTSKTVIVYGSPKADFVMPKQICLNDIISFVNTSSLGYGNTKFISNTWDFGDGSPLDYSVNPSHTFKSSGTYKVSLSVRADNSCVTSTFTADVIVIGYPTANFSVTNYCVESPILFKDLSTPGYGDKLGAWKWDFGDKAFSNLTNPTHIYKSTGTFPVNLIVSGSLCPSLESTITIPLKIIDRRKDSVYAIKYLQYNIAQTLCAVPGGDKYSWFPSTDINPINSRCVTINVQHPKTVYKITITDPAGCTINDTQEVWGFPGTDIFLPRAFIPASSNRDNSIFKPIYVGVTAIKYFKIYDRFGHEVFTTSDMSKFWDGTSNGVNQPMETYTWIIQGYDYNNKPIIRQGNVTLIRYQ
jgi:PKD repeat protein